MHSKLTFAGLLLMCGGMTITSSCATDPIMPSKTELYNREFIKNFGVFDRANDWNYSNKASVTVTTPSPTDIKIYANVNGKRYLFGTFLGVDGTKELAVDVPKGITSLIVKANGKDIVASVGSKVNLGQGSRVVKDPTAEGGAGITAELITDESKWMVVPMLNATMFRSKMPENCYNANREGVEVDFTLKFKENDIVIRPLYWQTNQTLSFGLFYINDEGNPVHLPIYDMEKTADYSDDLVLGWATADVKTEIVKDFANNEVFRKLMEDQGIEIVNKADMWNNTKYANIPNISTNDNFWGYCTAIDDGKITKACRAYLESIGYENNISAENPYNYVYRWRTVGNQTITTPGPANTTRNNIWSEDLEITFIYYNYDKSNIKAFGGSDDLLGANGLGTVSNGLKQYDSKGWPAMICKGIKVHIDDIDRTYGAYIKRGDGRYLYSVSSLNEKNRWIPKPDATRSDEVWDWQTGTKVWKYKQEDFIIEEGKKAYRAATWKGEKYPWRYMSFEDGVIPDNEYNASSCDFDMQDFVFLIDNVDPSPEDPIEVVTPEDPIPDTPYEWIIAVEDLGATDDFDFNDVVFGVSNPVTKADGKKYVTVRALASGGTLPIYVRYNGEDIVPEGTNNGEFHSWFEGNHPSNVVINAQGIRSTGKSYELQVDDTFTLSCLQEVNGKNMGGFSVKVVKKGNSEVTEIAPPNLSEEGGEAPQMMCLPASWQWPTERTHISEAYDKFADWTKNHSVNTDWHENVTNQSLVWQRTDIAQ